MAEPSPDSSIDLTGPITEASATVMITRILLAKKTGLAHEITIHLDSPGGDLNSTHVIYAAIQELRPLPAIVAKKVAGSAIVLFVACRPGWRILHENAVLHFAALESTDATIDIHEVTQALARTIARHTRATPEQVETWLNRSYRMPANEALALGFCDGLTSS